jgi:uncharacterized protein
MRRDLVDTSKGGMTVSPEQAFGRTIDDPDRGNGGQRSHHGSSDPVFSLRLEGHVVVRSLRVADTSGARMRGLLGKSRLDPGEGLWITPCDSIHMFFMRFPIDAVFVDAQMQVVRVYEDLQPWRMARGGKFAHSVLELPAGSAAFHRIRVGDRFHISTAKS